MKAPSAGYRILMAPRAERVGIAAKLTWKIVDELDGHRTVWRGQTYRGARTAHYRLSIARITGKPVSYAQARRAGNP